VEEGVPVPVRRTWIVVLLAAVFTMHGIPSAVAGGSSVPTSHVEVPASPGGVDLVPVGAMPGTGSATAHDAEAADREGPSHSMASHAWNACLAVLLMGMAWLAAAAVRRLPAFKESRVALRMHGSIAWVRPPRPPDLAALCLLRT
jgi:hypothetical protein